MKKVMLSAVLIFAMVLLLTPAMVSFADEAAEEPVYRFINAADGGYLYVWGNEIGSGNGIMTAGDGDIVSTQWRLSVKDDDYYVITNVNSGRVMEPNGGSWDAGVYLVQWDHNYDPSGNEWQNWQIKPIEVDSDGTVYYAIINRRSGLVIQTGWGDLARQYEYNGSKEQLWKAELVSGEPCLEQAISVTAESALTAAAQDLGSGIAKDALGIGFTITADGCGVDKITGYGFKLDIQTDENGTTVTAIEETDIDGNTAAIFPALNGSNDVLLFTPFAEIGGSRVYGEAVKTSLYTEVIEDLIAEDLKEYDAQAVITARAKNASAVIANGGLLESITDLGGWRGKIIEAAGDNAVKIKDSVSSIGVGFLYREGGIYVGSKARTDSGAAKDTIYTVLTLNSDGSITLSGEAGLSEAVTVYLESVDVVFVQEIITETTADSDLSNAAEFQDIL